MNVPEYIAYTFATCLFIFIVPGPIFFLSINEGVRGVRGGLMMVMGAMTGQALLVLVLATGLLLFLTKVMPEVSLLGAALLVWIGTSAILASVRGQTSGLPATASRGSFLRGFAMTLANPAFILWLLTVGATILDAGVNSVGSSAYPIFGLDLVLTSAGVSLLLIVLSSRGHRLTGDRGMRLLTFTSGVAFIVIATVLIRSILP